MGTLGWGMVMLALAVSSKIAMILCLRFVNGFFLACLAPLTTTWVAEHVPPARSGFIFGLIFSSASAGSLASTGSAVMLQDRKFPLPGVGLVSGWRLLCVCIGLLAFASSLVTWFFLEVKHVAEPRKLPGRPSMVTSIIAAFRGMVESVRVHWRSHTFRVISVQGIGGGMAANAMSFDIMFLQYMGMAPGQLILLGSIAAVPSLISSTTGGMFGDFLERQRPNHGRALTAQICVAGIMLAIFLQYVIFPSAFGPVVAPFAFAKCLLPMFGSMYHPGVMRPLLIEVADPDRRAMIIAWQHALEGICAGALGGPLVGLLSEHLFGYRAYSGDFTSMPPELHAHNFSALRKAVATMTLVPLSICFILNSLLHRAYPRDKRMWAEEHKAAASKEVPQQKSAFEERELVTLIGNPSE